MKYIKQIIYAVCLVLVFETSFVMADIYNASRAVIRVTVPDGIGSGIVVGSDGHYYYAVTNAHVASTGKAQVEFFDAGRVTKCDAETIQRDSTIDLAVLRIDTKGYNPSIVPIDPSFTMKSGDVLATIGHPLGKMPTCYFCTFQGSDDAFGVRFIPGPMQGRSGSPLLSSDGSRVVGIVYGITVEGNVGLAIPAKEVADFLQGAVDGRKRRSSWKPKESKNVKRLAAQRSILVKPDEEEEEKTSEVEETTDTLPDYEVVQTVEVVEVPKRIIKRPREGRPLINREGKRPRRPFRRKPEAQQPLETPQIEATKISVQVGDVEVGIGDEGKKEDPKPAPPAPPVPPPAPPVPHHPPHWFPPHHPVPPPHRPGPFGSLPKSESIILTQWAAPLYGAGTCPGGNCPYGNCPSGNCPYGNCPSGNCPIPSTPAAPKKPENITSPTPIPFEVAGKSPLEDLLPTPEPEAPKKKEEKKEEVASRFALKAPTDEKILALEKRVEAIEKRVAGIESTQKGIEETGLLNRKPIADALESGLGAAGENLGKAITVEVGADVHEALTQSVDSMKDVTLAVGSATDIFRNTTESGLETLKEATASFSGTMTTTQATLASVEECTKTVTKVIWFLAMGLIVLAFFTIYAFIYKSTHGNV